MDVTTDRLAYGGDAVARHDGLAIFIPLASPGERLRVRITERKKHYARASIEQIIEAAPQRRPPACRYFGECGGCQLQHLTYQAQLAAKTGFVRDALERIGRLDWPHEIGILHANEFGYRTRAQVKIDRKTSRVGFNRSGSTSVCDVQSCPILAPELDAGLASLREAVSKGNITDVLVAGSSQVEMAAGDSGISFAPAIGDLPHATLQRRIHNAVYNFSPSTFFQSNAYLLDKLIDEALDDISGELALDLFAGVGLFAIQLARRFKQVLAVEADSQTAKYAMENVSANSIANVDVQCSSAEAWLKGFVNTKTVAPDLILLDPPRTGAASSLTSIADIKAPRITYVSCDPTTLARDLRKLVDAGYQLSKVTAIDLFPQTYHVETVASLRLS